MRIVIASSEAVPYAKTGGLADVAAALPQAISKMGHEVWLAMPYYRKMEEQIDRAKYPIHETGIEFDIQMGEKTMTGELLWSELPNSNVTVLLIDQPDYFNRPQLYQENGHDYADNCERFAFFSRAVIEVCKKLVLRPHIVHANDWQTGLIPALLQTEYAYHPQFLRTRSMFTIHNLAYQGQFWHWDMELTGLDWKYFNWRQMEAYGQLNLMKTGIVFSDAITTVSPSYAKEIQTPNFGCGLEEVLATHHDKMSGILNGVDTRIWSPETDTHLVENYDARTVGEGKAVCKKSLQERLGLPQKAATPLIGMISRLASQKGLDIISQILEEVIQRDVQFLFLGTGESRYEDHLRYLANQYPDQIATYIGFDEGLAHQIEAGSDMFLMPSAYEPCGLNQMYSMLYGTPPIVHVTGGLADSVVDTTKETLSSGKATGFSFRHYNAESLQATIHRSLDLFDEKEDWNKLVQNCMKGDWSWTRSAKEYINIYQRLCSSPREAIPVTA
ncbi:Glycogen synthase [Polystyrenella longa]|uniref:Glycogen synthase n=1 Tax=Polystyrenella longa TaxID=2528007 RepID=A0A518CHZ3_9PLAN|nr:glycogen synthase GlgA [Polystyrenella longa]QDU78850.1 Glycogen synthase [Polystyrenella longa]